MSKSGGKKRTVLHQKGANGLLAEYHCARTLAGKCADAGLEASPRAAELDAVVEQQLAKYRRELTEEQFSRAENQGRALGEYLFAQLREHPERLGLPAEFVLRDHAVRIASTGHDTSKQNSADIELLFRPLHGGATVRLPVSLKAYASTTTSLGSKAAIASLGRLFLGNKKPGAEEIVRYFGPPAQEFLELLADFKGVADEFYDEAPEGKQFVDDYFARKGTRKVNNRLRRKELGAYYDQKRGFISEHRFATLFAIMFADGYRRMAAQGRWEDFLAAFGFLLGMDGDILTLNAVAGEDGQVTSIENSRLSSVHGRLRRALRPGVVVELISTAESGTLRVRVQCGDDVIDNLGLSIWKDATIQFKLTT